MTVVIIAHRLSTIKNVDHVYVLDEGRVVEEGAYHELRGHESRYKILLATVYTRFFLSLYMHLSDLSKQQWTYAVVIGAAVGGFATGLLAWSVSVTGGAAPLVFGFAVGAPLFFLLLTLLGSLNDKLNNILRRVNESEDELRAMTNVRPVLGSAVVGFGGWAMDAHLGETIARLVAERRPQLVVECGSGSSTVLVASCLRAMSNGGRVFSLDHEPVFAEKTRHLLQAYDLDDHATVLTAPLEAQHVNGTEKPWYGVDLGALPDRKIDLLIVDGPPGDSSPQARYPAVPLLRDRLAGDCIIVIDDGDRPDERAMAKQWAESLQGELEYGGGAKGTWVLQRQSRSAIQT